MQTATTKRTTRAKAAKPATTPAIKGFDANLACRGFQFAEGETYTHEGPVVACHSGFHAITGHPLAVFRYYPPAGSRFFRVELSGELHSDDQEKTAAAILTVGKEIGLAGLAQEAVDWVMARATLEGAVAVKPNGLATASGTQGAATASGYRGAATASGTQGAATASGYQGAATASGTQGAATASGTQGAATASGTQGAATASGTQGAATASGTQGAATASGYRGAATASGTQGAATASGDQGAATASGYRGAATASGYQGAATASGYQGAATASGYQGAAMSPGKAGKVMGSLGCVLFAVERGDWDGRGYPALSTASGIVGQDGIEADVWYTAKAGKLARVRDADRDHQF